MSWRVFAAYLLSLSAAACGKAEPTYNAISVMGYNYLPYNLEAFTITDAYGNQASGGGDDPPGGGGGVTCCYKLKGTQFTVKWGYVDVDQWHEGDERTFHAEAKVSMPPTPVPDDVGARILEVHVYPDQHIEFQFPGQFLDPARIPIVNVARWMQRFQKQLDDRYDERDDQQLRRIGRVVAGAWLKYSLTDTADLEQYTYFNLLVNSRFDAHPEIQRILTATHGRPGAFAKAMQTSPATVMSELKSDHFTAVPVPPTKDGLLPPPRVEEKKNG